ncbi:MAG: hypothetical protein V4539_11635 [Bacteroidota bacterium]
MTTAAEIIRSLYQQASGAANAAVASDAFYNICFIKNSEGITDIYGDIKKFIRKYLESVDDRQFGYDSVNPGKVMDCVSLVPADQQIKLYQFLRKSLLQFHFDKEWHHFERALYHNKKTVLTSRPFWYLRVPMLIRYAYYRSITSYKYLVFLVLGFLATEYLLLAPNPGAWWPTLFDVKYQDISSNFWLNHFENIMLSLLEIDNDFKITPLCAWGFVILVLGKSIKIVFIVKYVIDTLYKKVHIDE